MTRKKLIAGVAVGTLAVAVVTAGTIRAINHYRAKGSRGMTPEDRTHLSELIKRLRQAETGSDEAMAVRIRAVINRLERETGMNMRGLPGWLRDVRSGLMAPESQTLTYAEHLLERIESKAARDNL